MVWLLIESNVLRKIVILPSSTLKVRPSIRWFHILSFTTLPSLKMGALPPWNPGCRFNQARYRGWSYPSASPPIHKATEFYQFLFIDVEKLTSLFFIPYDHIANTKGAANKCVWPLFFQPLPGCHRRIAGGRLSFICTLVILMMNQSTFELLFTNSKQAHGGSLNCNPP